MEGCPCLVFDLQVGGGRGREGLCRGVLQRRSCKRVNGSFCLVESCVFIVSVLCVVLMVVYLSRVEWLEGLRGAWRGEGGSKILVVSLAERGVALRLELVHIH